MGMVNFLHDKIDRREQLAAKTHDAVERAKAQFADVFEACDGDIPRTLEALAEIVENELTDITTEAVRAGADGARKLSVDR